MAEYIEREAALASIRERCAPCGEGIEALKASPATSKGLILADPLELDHPYPRVGRPAVERQVGGLEGGVPKLGKSHALHIFPTRAHCRVAFPVVDAFFQYTVPINVL